MKKWILYGSWGCLYVLCAVLGFVVIEPYGLQFSALVAISALFFVPPALLLVDAYRQKDRKTLCVLRWVSGASLLLTLVFLVAYLFSFLGSETLGNVLYSILALASVPMVSSQYGFISMFLWACIFFATLGKKQK